jgi:hypothetical protein
MIFDLPLLRHLSGDDTGECFAAEDRILWSETSTRTENVKVHHRAQQTLKIFG